MLLTWLTRLAQLQPLGLLVKDRTIKIITGGRGGAGAWAGRGGSLGRSLGGAGGRGRVGQGDQVVGISAGLTWI